MWEPLRLFVRDVFGVPALYRSQCPHLALTLKIEGEGDIDNWHYDSNDGVVSILLKNADEGGNFEYAPYLRSEADERYDWVARVLADPETHAIRHRAAPGDFMLFNGPAVAAPRYPCRQDRSPEGRGAAVLGPDTRSGLQAELYRPSRLPADHERGAIIRPDASGPRATGSRPAGSFSSGIAWKYAEQRSSRHGLSRQARRSLPAVRHRQRVSSMRVGGRRVGQDLFNIACHAVDGWPNTPWEGTSFAQLRAMLAA